MKKVLIIYAMYGSGHRSVAQNIYSCLKDNKKIQVELLDMTEYANKIGKASFKYFDFVIKHRAELFFTTCYELVDNKLLAKFQKSICKSFFDNDDLRNKIKKFNPDLVIATHFYGSSIAVHYNKKNIIDAEIMTILTDYASHSEWLSRHKEKDYFIVPNEIVKRELVDFGVNRNKIYALGIPLETKKMQELDNKEDIRNKYDVNNKLPLIVFFGGSTAGSLTYFKLFKQVAIKNHFANIIFICGKNDKLRDKALKFIYKHNISNIKILGFTTDVYNLLSIADFVITKPGGATVTECMGFKLPMILIPGLGGQEKYNIKFIKNSGYGEFARNGYKLNKLIVKFLKKDFRNKIDRNYIKRNKYNASDAICSKVYNILKVK